MNTQLQSAATTMPGNSVSAYLQSLSSVSILSADEEQKLADKFYYQEDLDAARQLVLSHLRFVVHIAKSYNGYGLPMADLIQEGNVGLMKAVKRFNPEKGVRLVSFAVHWIKAEMHEFILRNWRIVKVATTKSQRKLFFNLRKRKSHLGWLTHDESKAIASDLGVDQAEVTRMEGRLAAVDSAFDLGVDDDEDSAFAPAQYLEDTSADPASLVEQSDWQSNSEDGLYAAMKTLDERARDIVTRRWLNEPKATLHELADEYGVSAERIRQLEANAMKKMRGLIDA